MKICHTLARPVQRFMAIALFFVLSGGQAQGLRDPTLPPAAANASLEAGQDVKPGGLEPDAMSVIVRNGRAYLVVDTRLYGQGDQVGAARVECITETEVWLREAGVLHKLARFPGIERRSALTKDRKSVV